ncbi:hypothetical protein QR77_21110 [Streptomyces sp. 150FB]|nr:hypothetical protein QR77_21110 [Streptomyces sp. 150FB]
MSPDRVDVLAVTDSAEIPTLQNAPRVDTDGDGTQSAGERGTWARARCAETAGKLAVTAPRRLSWTIRSATFAYTPGQAGLPTSRLECRLRAPLDLGNGPVTLHVTTGADAGRVGWNEITARGTGTRLQRSTAPETSPSDELRDYPRDLLTAPRGDVTAQFTATTGDEGSATSGGRATVIDPGNGLTARVEALSQHLASLAGARSLTVPVGLLAVLLSIVLGAGHALLPGHGKTVMAAYLAGRRGRTRDAVTVGATVTATHTAGVLVIGLCLTAFSSLAGDTVLNWLGVVSGALVTLVGANLLTDAVRRSRPKPTLPHAPHPSPTPSASPPALVGAAGSANTAERDHVTTASHASLAHPHPQATPSHHAHDHPHDHAHTKTHRHGLFGHHHSHGPTDTPTPTEPEPFSTRGLIGLGIAGGLVPSPSALVVLLGAIALGRTAFGATLVLAYGLGMAATLTAVGLLLVRLGNRVTRLDSYPLSRWVRRITPYTALLTAALVLVVGLGLMIRGLPTVL